MVVKNQLVKKHFYSSIINELKLKTNLTQIRNKLNISKQQLNYYLRQLKNKGLIIQKDKGWYEVINGVKESTKYGEILSKDKIRGHAYIWEIKISKDIKDWDKRIDILKSKGINYILVGALKNVPRIKVLGRKVWLCNNHIRIYELKDKSYYGNNSIESRKLAFQELSLIINTLERKLGVSIKPFDFSWKREHYAFIKNDLAIQQNREGNLWHICDENGEWLIIDDSLEKGGELENIGKKSFVTNPKLQKWWNDMKQSNFEVTPSFLLKSINQVTSNQLMFNKNFESHVSSIKSLGNSADANAKTVELLAEVVKELVDEVKILKEEIIKINENKM